MCIYSVGCLSSSALPGSVSQFKANPDAILVALFLPLFTALFPGLQRNYLLSVRAPGTTTATAEARAENRSLWIESRRNALLPSALKPLAAFYRSLCRFPSPEARYSVIH